MKRVVFSLPGMYADHHVLRVREALLGLAGVEHVLASAARKAVSIEFDEQALSAEKLQDALAQAGYAPDRYAMASETSKPSIDGSAWYTVLQRATKTEFKDREMAGDFRRY
jgi:copper chaperone CopZ